MKKTSSKGREYMVLKALCFVYLKTLLYKSLRFKKQVAALREKNGIKLKFKPDPNKCEDENDVECARFLRKLANPSTLYKDKDFRKLCREFFLPKHIWEGINLFICTDNSKRLLGNACEITTSNKCAAIGVKKKFPIPYSILYVRCDIQEQQLQKMWKNVANAQKLVNSEFFHEGVYQWKDGVSFDRAIGAYSFYEKGFKGNALLKKLKAANYTHPRSTYSASRIGEWRRNVETQIKSLQHWQLV